MSWLDDIRRRATNATSGPWAWEPHGDTDAWSLGIVLDDDEEPLSGALEIGQGEVVECICEGGVDGTLADADFVAHTRADVPALLAVADAAEGLLCEPLYVDPETPGCRLVPAELLDHLRVALAPISDRVQDGAS